MDNTDRHRSKCSISNRAEVFIKPPMSYLGRALEAVFNEYSESNPMGGIPLAIAENKLSADLLLAKLKTFHGYTAAVLNYTDTTGLPAAKAAIAQFLESYVFKCSSVLPSNLVVSSGCTGILNELSILLFDKDDSVLIPAPYYAAFDPDFMSIGSVTVVPVWPVGVINPYADFVMANQWIIGNLTVESLDDAHTRATAAGHKPKALLIVNPGNPSGTIYTKEQLLIAVTWTRKNSMHLIVDEIYALSVYDSPIPFTSIVSLLENQLGDDVHVMWGLSKDFGASGLRLGVLYTQNKQLLSSITNMNTAFQVSNLVQEMAAYVLQDRVFIDSYLYETKLRLKRSYDILRTHLEAMGIMVVTPAGAGIFCFADFRVLLTEQTFKGEEALFNEMADRGVILTPGKSCHCQIPGFFRVCFAWVSVKSLLEAIRRIKEISTTHPL